METKERRDYYDSGYSTRPVKISWDGKATKRIVCKHTPYMRGEKYG